MMRKRVNNDASLHPNKNSMEQIPKNKVVKAVRRLMTISAATMIFGAFFLKTTQYFHFTTRMHTSSISTSTSVSNSASTITTGANTSVSTSVSTSTSTVLNIADSKLARNSGDGWKIADWKDSASIQQPDKEGNFKCDWTTFKAFATGKTAEMCVHPFNDLVSGHVRRHGGWGDCNALSHYWNENVQDANSVYLEIGANIGTCVMEMLLGTNANIIAFEPHPMNIFVLQQTISKLDSALQDRVRLVPVGLGDKKGSSTIFSANNNMGNSVIGAIVKDGAGQKFDEKLQYKVHIERLDSIIKSDTHVKLMKMDAQGFECNILEGMGQDVASGIETIKFEYSHSHLAAQNCTDLLDKMRSYGYNIYKHGPHVATKRTFRTPVGPPRDGDLFANRQPLSAIVSTNAAPSLN